MRCTAETLFASYDQFEPKVDIRAAYSNGSFVRFPVGPIALLDDGSWHSPDMSASLQNVRLRG